MSETEPANSTREREAPEAREPPKFYSGGAGRYEGLEARIASIEAHVDHIRDDIGDMRLDLKELARTMNSSAPDIPEPDRSSSGTGWVLLALLVIAAAISGVIIYLEPIRQHLGLIPPSP